MLAVMDNLFPILWLSWLLSFVAIELAALYLNHRYPPADRSDQRTLTSRIRAIFRGSVVMTLVLGVFFAVLGYHFIWDK